MSMSNYETNELAKIHKWKHPEEQGFFGKVASAVNAPFAFAGEQIMKVPGTDYIIEKAIVGTISLANDAAQWSVRPDSIVEEYKQNDTPVQILSDVYNIDLSNVDKCIGYLGAKYKTIAMGEGVGTGAIGLAGMAIDIPALILLNLRAIGEYATYCGFDVSLEHERVFALQVLGLASSPTDAAKQVTMAQLVKIASDVAKKKAWKDLQNYAFVKMVQELAKQLGIRLTKAKLAQVVPVAGAAVGGGYNAYYTGKVCEAAYMLYRERFLAEKYGAHVLSS